VKIALAEKEDIAFLNAFAIWAVLFEKEDVTVKNNNVRRKNVFALAQMHSATRRYALIALEKELQKSQAAKIMQFLVTPSKRPEWEDQPFLELA